MITITKEFDRADPKLFDGGATFDGQFILETAENTLELNYTGSPNVGVGQALFFPLINAEIDAFDFSFTLTRISADEFELTAGGESTILSDPTIRDLQDVVGEFLGVDNSGHPDGNYGPDASNLPTIDAGAPERVDGAHVVSGPVSSFYPLVGEADAFDFVEHVLLEIQEQTESDPRVADGYWLLLAPLPAGASPDGHALFFLGEPIDYDALLQVIEDNDGGVGGGDRIFKFVDNNHPLPTDDIFLAV